LSNANAMTVASVAARLLAKAAAFLDEPAAKNTPAPQFTVAIVAFLT
jgi:hypothetical protein